jgi:D-serine deaminase-like pyridoxal phosphate-dependent protein
MFGDCKVNDSITSRPRDITLTPALILDLDVFERNVELLAAKARKWGVSLRPHAKTHKSAEIALRQLHAGAIGVTCATLGEADLMARSGVPSILISSPLVTEAHVARLVSMMGSTSEILLVVDSILGLERLSAAARTANRVLRVLVDYDVGQHRTGCATIDGACRLAALVAGSHGLEFRGIQAYAGHIQHIENVEQRESAAHEVLARVQQLRSALRDLGLNPAICTGSGTGTADFDGPSTVFTELQAGSYIFMDVEYLSIQWPGQQDSSYGPALFVDTTVISAGWPDHVTTDAGVKAFSQGGPPPRLLNLDARLKYKCDSDEHGHIETGNSAPLPTTGTRITCVVPHCDPTVSLYREYLCVRDDIVVCSWPIEPRR